jgi:hypothetical protein
MSGSAEGAQKQTESNRMQFLHISLRLFRDYCGGQCNGQNLRVKGHKENESSDAEALLDSIKKLPGEQDCGTPDQGTPRA